MKRYSWILLCCFLLTALPARGQFYSAGTDPGAVRWSEIRTDNYRLIYPRGTDSLARAYALSLQRQYPRAGLSLGYAPSELCRKPMPVILHPFTSYGNGMVMWAPRRMELYSLGDPSDPDPMPWMLNLTTHEPRHAAQLQFGRRWPFKALRYVVGDLSDVAWWSIYTGIAFSEGDAVVTETALTPFGRGRTADFLEYVRVAFDEGDWRDYWRWRYGSNRLYTPDHYRAGYLLAAGLRTSWDEPLFLKKYHDNLFSRKLPLPFFNMPYTIRQVTGLSFQKAWDTLSQDFQAIWAANDSLRAQAAGDTGLRTPDFAQVFISGTPLTPSTRRYSSFRGATAAGDDIYAVQTGLERAARLVRISPDGTVSSLGPFSATASDLRYAAGRLYWSEEIRDPRWELAGTSVVRMMDLSTGRKQTLMAGEKRQALPEGFRPDAQAIRCLPDGGRYYNPAPSEDGQRLAAMHYATDGSHQVVITDAATGFSGNEVTLSILTAPAGLQPAQGAWIGNTLYVSGVTDEGFGIYDATGGWRTVLPGRSVKIKQLRSREGRLWFVCDKNGVNELYSCDPVTGSLRQETSLRHGGSEFVWNAAGDTLRYTVLSTGGRRFHSTPVSALAPQESSWDEIWRHPVAEELAAQERALEAERLGAARDSLGRGLAGSGMPGSGTEGIFVSGPKPYRKAAHLLRFHTWAPMYIDYDAVSDLSFSSLYSAATLGATAFFQNDLATAVGSIGYSAKRQAAQDWRHLLDLRFTYKGWYPVIETALQISNGTPYRYQFTRLTAAYPSVQEVTDQTDGAVAGHAVATQRRTGNQVSSSALSGPDVSFTARIYIPLVFSSGGWNRGFIPQLRYTVSNSLYDGTVFWGERYGLFPSKDRSMALTGREPGSTVLLQNLTASVRGYVMRPTAASGVYPRWGIGAELGAGIRPALTHIYDPAVYGYLYGYLPGVLPEHGLKLTALTQMQWSRGVLGRTVADMLETGLRNDAAGRSGTADKPAAGWSGTAAKPAAYIQEQRVVTYPRGYAAAGGALGRYLAERYPFQTKWTADYLMAVLPLDWSGLGPVAYLKDFELGLHFDAALYLPGTLSQETRLGSGTPGNGGASRQGSGDPGNGGAALMSAGSSLSVRLGNLLWVPFDTRIGVSWSCNFGPSYESLRRDGLSLNRHYFGLLFSIDY